MLTQAPKGTKDVLPQDSYRFQTVEAVQRASLRWRGTVRCARPSLSIPNFFCAA